MPAKRCPMCRRVNAGPARRCACRHDFASDPVTVREQLRDRLESAVVRLAVLVAIDLAIVAGVTRLAIATAGGSSRAAALAVIAFAAASVAMHVTARTVDAIAISRASLATSVAPGRSGRAGTRAAAG